MLPGTPQPCTTYQNEPRTLGKESLQSNHFPRIDAPRPDFPQKRKRRQKIKEVTGKFHVLIACCVLTENSIQNSNSNTKFATVYNGFGRYHVDVAQDGRGWDSTVGDQFLEPVLARVRAEDFLLQQLVHLTPREHGPVDRCPLLR